MRNFFFFALFLTFTLHSPLAQGQQRPCAWLTICAIDRCVNQLDLTKEVLKMRDGRIEVDKLMAHVDFDCVLNSKCMKFCGYCRPCRNIYSKAQYYAANPSAVKEKKKGCATLERCIGSCIDHEEGFNECLETKGCYRRCFDCRKCKLITRNVFLKLCVERRMLEFINFTVDSCKHLWKMIVEDVRNGDPKKSEKKTIS